MRHFVTQPTATEIIPAFQFFSLSTRKHKSHAHSCYYEADSGVHIHAPPFVADDFDVRKITRPDPMDAERMRDRIEAVRLYCAQNGTTHSVMGWVEGPAAEAADLRQGLFF